MISKGYVYVAFAVKGLEIDFIGVYESLELAKKRARELKDLGVIGDRDVAILNEILWGEKEDE